MQRLWTFLSVIRGSALSLPFVGVSVGFWQWGWPLQPRVVLQKPGYASTGSYQQLAGIW